MPALEGAGFRDVELFGPHAAPDPDFSNVPDHVSNPERPIVFERIIDRAKAIGADLILATDPDCDRVGCAAPSLRPDSPWGTLTGNQIGSLLADYLLQVQSGRHTHRKTLCGQNARDHGTHPPDCRRPWRPNRRRFAGRVQVYRRRDGGSGTPRKFTSARRVVRISDRRPRTRQGRGGGLDDSCRVGRGPRPKGLSLHEKLDSLFRRYGCHAEKIITRRSCPGPREWNG